MESCSNLPGPSGKAKYSPTTDSEPVPRGKGEKNPDDGSEIEPETVRLQAVEALWPKGNVRRRAFCIMSRLVTLCGKVKDFRSGAAAKASLNRAFSRTGYTRNRVIYP